MDLFISWLPLDVSSLLLGVADSEHDGWLNLRHSARCFRLRMKYEETEETGGIYMKI